MRGVVWVLCMFFFLCMWVVEKGNWVRGVVREREA